MTDENANTADLTINEKLERILQRMAALEAQGANTTRPPLDQIVKEMVQTRETLIELMDGMGSRLERIEKQLEVMTLNVMQVRADQRRLEDRMDAIERRLN
jgi:phosphopantothenate synthetase